MRQSSPTKAGIIEALNGIENARLTEVADPVPAAGEVLLRVSYAALNPTDRYLAQGEYPAKPPLPHILDREGSGVRISGIVLADFKCQLFRLKFKAYIIKCNLKV